MKIMASEHPALNLTTQGAKNGKGISQKTYVMNLLRPVSDYPY